jgi:hypothetical protein
MKLYLPFLIVTLFASCSNGEKKDIDYQGINGSVFKVSEMTYTTKEKFGELSKGRLESKNISEYNDQGNILKETYTSFPDPELDTLLGGSKYNTKSEFITLSKFDDKGRRIATLNGKTNEIETKYIYNEDGKVTEVNSYREGKLSSKTKYTYNGSHLQKSNNYNADGSLESTKKYKVNDDDLVIEAADFTNENKLSGKTTFSFDDKLITGYKSFKGNRLTDAYAFKYVKFDDRKS